MIPRHNAEHWNLVIINNIDFEITIYDSLFQPVADDYEPLLEWLQYKYFVRFDINIISVDIQRNGFDCGPFGNNNIIRINSLL